MSPRLFKQCSAELAVIASRWWQQSVGQHMVCVRGCSGRVVYIGVRQAPVANTAQIWEKNGTRALVAQNA